MFTVLLTREEVHALLALAVLAKVSGHGTTAEVESAAIRLAATLSSTPVESTHV